jgi:hypothetical protein
VRVGLVLESPAGIVSRARHVEEAGFDLLWLAPGATRSAPFVTAATLASDTIGLRIGVQTALGHAHPIHLAEDAAVCDLVLRGRLVLGLEPAPGHEDNFPEGVSLLLASHRSRPFRHPGPRWPTPANLDANTFSKDERVRVTPAPAQTELPTWIVGDDATATAFGLPPVVVSLDDGEHTRAALDRELGARTIRLPRPAIVDVPLAGDRVDHNRLVAALRTAQRAWGLDTALLRLPVDDTSWPDLVTDLQRLVRPRVQLDRLPPGLEGRWDRELVR